MKSPYIRELQPEQTITGAFLVRNKEIRQKKTGGAYLSLSLGDRTGEIDAKMWDNVDEVLEDFDRDDFIKLKAMVQIYHNRPQLTVHKVRKLDDSEVDFADFFPASERNVDQMWTELRDHVAAMSNPHLKKLLDALLDDEEVAARFRKAPAGKSIHHAFLGGLLEHVLSICSLCKVVSAHYGHIDCDLLTTGAVLHDIGKIYELSYDRGFGYTTDGQLLGHIIIALRMVSDKLREVPDFPLPLRTLVEHMIISHQGQLEFGSPKVPQFPEALLLHYLDDLDSKMECMRALIARDQNIAGHFTGYSASLERSVLNKQKYLGAEPPQPVPTKPQAVSSAAPASAAHPLFAPKAPATAPETRSVPSEPAAPAPAQQRPPVPPVRQPDKPGSVLAEKLQQALRSE